MLNLSSEQRQQYPHRIEYLDQPLLKKLPHSALTAIVFCFKQKSSIMFFSLVVLSLFLASGRAASDLDPNNEGEDEMEFAVVSSKFSSIKVSTCSNFLYDFRGSYCYWRKVLCLLLIARNLIRIGSLRFSRLEAKQQSTTKIIVFFYFAGRCCYCRCCY